MSDRSSLETLWESAPQGGPAWTGASPELPEAARRYLEHAIAPGTPRASTVRLKMHGEIKLKRWLPFEAEEVLGWRRGMIWSATVRQSGLPIRGSDRLIDGAGAMRWKLFGIVPVLSAASPDITRSAVGRAHAEAIWLPSVLAAADISWNVPDATHLHVHFTAFDAPANLVFTTDPAGRLQSVKTLRWGQPEGAEFHYADFGGLVEEEKTFGGYTIPSRLRLGWFFGADRFESEGEFFQVTVDEATYR